MKGPIIVYRRPQCQGERMALRVELMQPDDQSQVRPKPLIRIVLPVLDGFGRDPSVLCCVQGSSLWTVWDCRTILSESIRRGLRKTNLQEEWLGSLSVGRALGRRVAEMENFIHFSHEFASRHRL